MASTGVRSRYHIAINGNGFVLRGTPASPQYVKEDAPTLVNQLGTGDLDYNKLNGAGWSYRTQTDWSGGFQKIKFEDNGSFKDGQAVDVISKFGEIRLQNAFVSASVITGSHTIQSYSIHEHKLLLGTAKSAGAKVFSLTSANTLATLSAYSTISAVMSLERFGDNTLVGLKRQTAVSASVKTFAKYNGTSISAFRAAASIVRTIRSIGVRAYYAEFNDALSGDQLGYTTDLSTFTSAYNAGKGREISQIEQVAGAPYFFVKEGNKVDMFKWDEFGERAYPINSWDNLTSFGVTRFLSFIIISGKSNGKSVAFAFNGARLWQIFDDQLLDTSYDFSKPFVFKDNLHTKGAFWDGQYWFPGLYGKYATVQYTPFINFGNRAYGFAVTGTTTRIGFTSGGKYATSGHLISSELGHEIGGVDKLVNSVDINFDTLTSGQTVELFRSTDGGSSFTTIGKAQFSVDGAINKKTLYFPSGFVTKLWNSKLQMATTVPSTTPVVKDITFQYRPTPDLKKRWRVNIDAGDNIVLLNRQKEERDGKDIISRLWLEKEAKRTVVYEDLDAWNTTLVSGITKTATSAIVGSVRLMPPRGRMRVVSGGVVEEMTYTSADGNRIKGISRGQKGTVARAYLSGQQLDNFYNIVVTDIREQSSTTDEKKTESIATVTLLEV